MSKIGDKYKGGINAGFEKMFENVIKNNMTFKDAAGLTPVDMEEIYNKAYRLYNAGKYKDASSLFRFLTLVDPTTGRYSMGLSSCFQMLKDYQSAVTSYFMTSILDPKNPMPFYHAADCYIQLDLPYIAVIQLKKAIELCGDNPRYAIIKERSTFMVEGLERNNTKTA